LQILDLTVAKLVPLCLQEKTNWTNVRKELSLQILPNLLKKNLLVWTSVSKQTSCFVNFYFAEFRHVEKDIKSCAVCECQKENVLFVKKKMSEIKLNKNEKSL